MTFGRRIAAVALIGAMAAAAAPTAQTPQAGGAADILVSRQLMVAEHLQVGDLVSLSSESSGANPQRFRIAGQYEPTPDPMRLGQARHEVRLHLPDLIDLAGTPADPLDAERVDALNVAVAPGADARELARRLDRTIPGVVTQSTADDERRAAPFVVLDRFHLAIAIVTVLASSVFLLALMLMLVDERRSTVAVLRLIGFRRGRILQHVLAEGVVITLSGAVFGVLLSVLMQGGINQFFQWRYDTALVFVRVTPGVVLRSIAVSIPLGMAAILASSWSLLRREGMSLTRR